MWDEHRVRELTDDQLIALLTNARKLGSANKNADAVRLLCEAEHKRRGLGKVKLSRRSEPIRRKEDDLAVEIGEFATSLADIYDLSAETAKRLSAGTPRFQPHQLTQKNGAAKIGGLQKSGRCRIDRYVSYRRTNDIVSLNIWLPNGVSDDAIEFQVFGPRELIENCESIISLRPSVSTEKEMNLFGWGVRTKSLEEAKELFAHLVSRVASQK